VIDSLAREINLSTGQVLLNWSAYAHVPITASYALPLLGSSPWDFFHINSISPAPDGNLLISSRHMWALYEINPTTGDINWTLGGKQSTFTMAPGASFAWQHEPRFLSPNEIQLFDDEEGTPFPSNEPQSRAIWLHLDYATDTASLIKQIVQGDLLLDDSLPPPSGTVTLPNGQTVPNAWSTYRVFKENVEHAEPREQMLSA